MTLWKFPFFEFIFDFLISFWGKRTLYNVHGENFDKSLSVVWINGFRFNVFGKVRNCERKSSGGGANKWGKSDKTKSYAEQDCLKQEKPKFVSEDSFKTWKLKLNKFALVQKDPF